MRYCFTLFAVAVNVLVSLACCCPVGDSPKDKKIEAVKRPPEKVTRENYNKIRTGMSLRQVEAILGVGRESARDEFTQIMVWRTANGFMEEDTIITMMLDADGVRTKAIAGGP